MGYGEDGSRQCAQRFALYSTKNKWRCCVATPNGSGLSALLSRLKIDSAMRRLRLNSFRACANQAETKRSFKKSQRRQSRYYHRHAPTAFCRREEFKDLGLIVIDEEHRFGVTDKEKLKRLRESVHVFAMTATPIPRTLNMAMSGI